MQIFSGSRLLSRRVLQSILCLSDNFRKRLRLMNCQIGQNFSIEFNAGEF